MTTDARDSASWGSAMPLNGVTGSSTRRTRPVRSRKGRRAARSLARRQRRTGEASRVRARACEERRSRERVHVSCLLQRSSDDVVVPRSISPPCEVWPGAEGRAELPAGAASGLPRRWQSHQASCRKERASARASRVSSEVESIEGASGHRRSDFSRESQREWPWPSRTPTTRRAHVG